MPIRNNYDLNTLYKDITVLKIKYSYDEPLRERILPTPENVPNLKKLSLICIIINNGIPDYPNLEELYIENIKHINLRHNKFPKLKKLVIFDTDYSLPIVAPRLTKLTIDDRIKKRIPFYRNCKINIYRPYWVFSSTIFTNSFSVILDLLYKHIIREKYILLDIIDSKHIKYFPYGQNKNNVKYFQKS
jgi:hypothetical protein